jgi:MFS family permease
MYELPANAKAVIQALNFSSPSASDLRKLASADWTLLLTHHQFIRLTIPLRQTCGEHLPEWVRLRIDRHIADNAARLEKLKARYSEIADVIRDAGAEHMVIKGFAQWPDFTDHPCFHAQSDIDLYCPADSILKAQEALLGIAYVPEEVKKGVNADHLPAMSRANGWHWKGNFFDPEMPPSVELHHCLWDRKSHRIDLRVEDQFWARRAERSLDGLVFPALAMVDNLGHSALQVLRDCIIDAVAPERLYELARFLHLRSNDEAFWRAWSVLHDDRLRGMEAIAFRVASDVFDCQFGDPVAQAVRELPLAVQKWFERFGGSIFDRGLDRAAAGLWLQTALIESARDRRAVVFERLVPSRPVSLKAFENRDKALGPPSAGARPVTLREKYRRYLALRVRARGLSFFPTLWNGARYWWSTKNLSGGYWNLFGASFLFALGMFVFFLLYNLYLLDRGLREQFIGLVTGAASVGAVVGTILGGVLADRMGLRRMLLLCFPLLAAVCALRVTMTGVALLVGLALVGGACASLWGVGLSPAVAQLTTSENRSFAFSLILAAGIATGTLGGLFGGHLPGWLSAVSLANANNAKQIAILIGCGLVALGTWPISRIRFGPISHQNRALYPRNPFLLRFLPAMAAWSFFTGAFSPFANAYLSQHLHIATEHVGTIFSVSQLVQMLAVLAAPLLFRRFGLINGIVSTQIAAAIGLVALAVAPASGPATILFPVFSAFQWMSEPGIFTLLMDRMLPEERTGASALMFLVISLSQAISEALSGAGYLHFGYPVVMFVSAGLALFAAMLFRTLLHEASAPTAAGRREFAA